MSNVIQGKFKSAPHADTAPPCRECRAYNEYRDKVFDANGQFGKCLYTQKLLDLAEIKARGTTCYASLMRIICQGRYFEPMPRTFWQRLGDAIIERVKK